MKYLEEFLVGITPNKAEDLNVCSVSGCVPCYWSGWADQTLALIDHSDIHG